MKTTDFGISAIQFNLAQRGALVRQAENLISSLEYAEKCYMVQHEDGSYTDPLIDDDYNSLATLKAIRELANAILNYVEGTTR